MGNSLQKIYYVKPSITELEVQFVTKAAELGWGDNCYESIAQFEKLFSEHIGTKYAHATSSATGALQLGLAALGIGQGDEVILADTNWIASVAPFVHLGVKPVFVDILPETWCLDPEKVRAAITPRTKAILAVHIYGNLCDMDALEKIANEYNLYLIEDAAEAIGSHWRGKQAGSRGVFGIFSFHGSKTITTGEGGMFVTNNEELYEKVAMLNNHGRKKNDTRQFWASEVGYKYKMSNLQAALGCAQMQRIEDLIQRRRDIFFTYYEGLKNQGHIKLNPILNDGSTLGYWMPSAVFSSESGITQQRALGVLAQNNIDGRAFFSPLSLQASFVAQKHNIISHDIYLRAINLPCYHELSAKQLEYIIDCIKSIKCDK